MAAKRNISKKKVWQFITVTALLCIIIPVMIFAVNHNRQSHVDKIEIIYLNDKHVYISHESVLAILNEVIGRDVYETEVQNLDLRNIEEALNEHPWIKNAEVYINKRQKLVIKLLQNQPIARLFFRDQSTMYIDSTGVLLPVIYVYPNPIPVFTSVPAFTEKHESVQLRQSIIDLSQVILSDSFWNAQITQVNINNGLEFDITTIMGDFIVKMARDADYKEKFNNLHIFFNKGLSKLGWDVYDYIDLRYKNQIVTSPALDYIAPPPTDTMIVVPDNEQPIENDHMFVERVDSATA